MIFKKDSFLLGIVLGLLAPFVGFTFFKYLKLQSLSYWEALQFVFLQPEHAILTAAISVSLLANAALFTLFVNAKIDKTAKGIFVSTLVYAIVALCVKFFT